MTRLRRFGLYLFLPLCLQLGLAGKAIACVNELGAPAAEPGMAMNDDGGAMAGMDMSANSPSSRGSERHGNAPCDGPFNPANCQPLAACAAGVLAPTAVVVASATSVPSDAAPLVVLTPSSWTVRPDLPPPRV